ncbi:MAG: hypothetical protein ACTSSC_11720 [Promethearchaeota archaeon]
MNSIERVEAALNFDSPDKVPTWGLGNTSDIFVQIMVPSKDWKPGWREEEKGLFPHSGDDMLIQSGIYKWECLSGQKAIQNIKEINGSRHLEKRLISGVRFGIVQEKILQWATLDDLHF